jgi:hypothetical protein
MGLFTHCYFLWQKRSLEKKLKKINGAFLTELYSKTLLFSLVSLKGSGHSS